MNYQKLSEQKLDEIMSLIREDVKAASNQVKIDPVAQSDSDSGKYWKPGNVEPQLSMASVGKTIGLIPAPMNAQRGIKRKIAKFIEKIYCRISELTNRDIREFNSQILNICVTYSRNFDAISDQINSMQECLTKNQEELANIKVRVSDESESRLTQVADNFNKLSLKLDQLDKMSQQASTNTEQTILDYTAKIDDCLQKTARQLFEMESLIKKSEQDILSSVDKKILDITNETHASIDNCMEKTVGQLHEMASLVKTDKQDILSLVDKKILDATDEMRISESDTENSIKNIIEKVNEFSLKQSEYACALNNVKAVLKWENSKKFADTVKSESSENKLDDLFYHDFEETFRGSELDIQNRLRYYLPLINEHFESFIDKQFLDIGCGRGEWMDLLQSEGVQNIIGIDTNALQVEVCTGKGLAVFHEEALTYLSKLDNASIDVITAFQVIEHLGINELITFLCEAQRVLRPNGLIILETPNASNLLVGASTFWIDPTHHYPIHKSVLQYLLNRSGFVSTQIHELNPNDFVIPFETPLCTDGNQKIWDQNIKTLNKLLYGGQDYAAIGVKNE